MHNSRPGLKTFKSHDLRGIQASPVHVPLRPRGYLAVLLSCFNNLNTKPRDKPPEGPLPPIPAPAPLRRGEISAANFPAPLLSPKWPRNYPGVGLQVPPLCRQRAPRLGTRPASGVCAEAVGTVGEPGHARVLGEPSPGALSQNPLPGVRGRKGRGAAGGPTQDPGGARVGAQGRAKPSGGRRLRSHRGGGPGSRGGREGTRQGGSSPATAAATRPSNGSRTAGSAGRGMTAAADGKGGAPGKCGAPTNPPTRPASGRAGEKGEGEGRGQPGADPAASARPRAAPSTALFCLKLVI